jgi:hypothetical protein
MALPAVYLTRYLEPHEWAHTRSLMISALVGHYRCPDDFLQLELRGPLSPDSGYFRFGNNAICYGRSSTGYRTPKPDALLYNALDDLRTTGAKVLLPFDPTEIITNLRMERYARHGRPTDWSWRQRFLRDAYYYLRPRMGVGVRKYLQRLYASRWRHLAFPHWPVDTSVEQLNEALLLASMRAQGVDRMPFVWFWPDGARSCLLMTHDVESRVGYDFCGKLMDIDDAHNIKACFQLVPEGRYRLRDEILQDIRERGFEANIQDLNHDGYLFADREEFLRRAKKINEYGRAYKAKGFRAAVLYRNPDWYDALEFSYDMSIPNVAHLDPQSGGCCTVMPYFIGNVLGNPAHHNPGLHAVPCARQVLIGFVEGAGRSHPEAQRLDQFSGPSRLRHRKASSGRLSRAPQLGAGLGYA